MSNKQPQEATPLVPVGGQIILLDNVFEVVAHTTDKNGRAVEVPGRCLGKAPTQSSAATRTAAAPRPRGRRSRAARGDYRRFRQRPPELKIVNEPWTAGQWGALIVVLTLIVAGPWLYNAGAEQRKWEGIEGAARAVQRR